MGGSNVAEVGSDAGQMRGWLDSREELAWRRFLSVHVRLRRTLSRELQREAGLSDADYVVLVHLSEAPRDRLRPYELGDAAEWEKSRLSHHLTRMERRGLIARETCPTDTRGAFIVLTSAGRAAIEAAAPLHVEHVRRWFLSVLTPEQLDTLSEISVALLAGLDPGEGGLDSECDGTGNDGSAPCSGGAGLLD
jgi:DNA-binding MarR family transcriptional regulator